MHAHIEAFLKNVNMETKTRRPCEPKPSDLSGLCKIAKRDDRIGGTRYSKAPYQPVGECSAKLLLKEAYCIGYEQNSYDDTSVYVVPVEGSFGSDECGKNLSAFMSSLHTANGIAGYGSTWSAERDSLNGVVILWQRSSIAD